MDKGDVVHIYIQCNSTQPERKDEFLPFATTCIHLENIMLSEISQRKKNTI